MAQHEGKKLRSQEITPSRSIRTATSTATSTEATTEATTTTYHKVIGICTGDCENGGCAWRSVPTQDMLETDTICFIHETRTWPAENGNTTEEHKVIVHKRDNG